MKKFLLCLAASFTVASALAQSDAELVMETVDRATIEGHIYFLADDLLKGRETGTPENKIAASYLANQLRGYGVMPDPATGTYYQAVPMEKRFPPASMELMVNGQKMENAVAMRQGSLTYSGDMMYMGYGLEADYNGKDVKGKVVIVQAGSAEANTAQQAFGR